MMRLLLVPLILLLLAPAFGAPGDRDGDGLPDDIEVKLGTNPDRDEGLQLLVEDGARGKGDRSVSPDGSAPDIDRVYFAHVGGDRYVWKITFHADLPAKGTILHLYVDADDDRETGRQDTEWVRGTDLMYSAVDGAFALRPINPAVRVGAGIPARTFIEGNAAYVCDDLKMRTADGKTRFRMHVLSHLKETPNDSDRVEWMTVTAPLHPGRTAPRLPYPQPEGFDRLSMPDFAQLVHSLWQDARTVRLRPKDAAVAGYTVLMNDDFEGKGEPGEEAAWKCPVEGRYHVGLILRDAADRLEGLDVLIGEKRVGTVVGYSPSGRDALYTTTAPLDLKRGDMVRVRSAEKGSAMRFHSVCLLAAKPKVPTLAIENLAAWHLPDEPGQHPGRILLSWTTNRPAEATLAYAIAGPEAVAQQGTLPEGRGAVNNHFVLLPPGLSASAYRFEVTCREPAQEEYTAQTATASLTVWREPRRHAEANGIRLPQRKPPARIPLTVREPAGRGRAAWPVSSGVPLPDGLLSDPQACRLRDAAGDDVPAQFRALAWWPGGVHVKWLLVDFLARTEAGKDAAYTLECGVPAAPVRSTLVVRAAGGGPAAARDPSQPVGRVALPVTVSTGRLALELGEGGLAPFAAVTLDGKRVGAAQAGAGGFELTDEKGTLYSSALVPPDEVLIEDAGPVRATLLVRGRLASRAGSHFMRYLCRLHFAAGQPHVRVSFTLENDIAQPMMSRFGQLQVRVPADLAGAAFSCGADGSAVALAAGASLLQDGDSHFTAGGQEGKRADGWVMASGGARGLAVAVRDFWQLYPKALAADAAGVTIGLLPRLLENQYAGASEDDLNKLFFWCDRGLYKVRCGVRLTTDLAVDFAPAAGAGGVYASGEHWQKPLFAACAPAWYAASGAFGPMSPRVPGKFEVYEKSLDAAFAKFIARREQTREYGFMNYGDWFGERRWNWGNQEYDTQWSLATAFARTGNLEMLWRAEEAERHNADIDTIHHSANAGEIGQVYTHCIGHTGGYFPESWKGMGFFNRGPRDSGHTWTRGHFALYALTGERRFLETGTRVADWFARSTTDFRYYSERNAGWPLIGLVGAYHFTGNPVYLNAGKLITDTVVWTQHPDRGGWGHFLDPNECKHTPRCWGCKPFMTGVLLHGLKLYDLAQPRDEVKRTIVRNGDFLWRETYVAADQGFAYSECKSFIEKGGKWTISLVGDGLAYGCLLDPERKHRERLREATAAFLGGGVSDFGKTFTQGTCFLPLMLHDLDALGLTEFPAPRGSGSQQ